MDRSIRQSASTTTRPLLLRRRPDLHVEPHEYQGRRYWLLKDPVTLKYFRFEDEEFALVQMLDGQTSLADVRRRFERQFAPQRITFQELHQFLGMLHRSSLIVSDAPGQGRQLRLRHDEQKHRERLAMLANPLCIRLRGFDPDWLLTWLERRLGWCFSRTAALASLLLMLAAALLVAVQFDVFQAKLPAFHEFFAVKNWLWLAVTLAVTKILHEFGHGLACKRFGGECHELGAMLLVFTPCLYCNVSDSWMLPSKWRRAMIAAAGIYVELILASLATFLWWFTEPGLLHYLSLNVMFVCSLSTLGFNANPLMRYDGYYILCDLLEIPNLRQKASTILRRKLSAWLLGMTEPADPFLPRRRQFLFGLYTVASEMYRWFVAVSILWFLNQALEPYGLKVMGQLLAIATLAGMVWQPMWQAGQFFASPGRIERVKKPRLLLSAAAVLAVLVGILAIPLPHCVRCVLQVQPRDSTSVYVEVPGSLRDIHIRPGDSVTTGQPLLTLENTDLRLEIARLRGRREELVARQTGLWQRAFRDDSAPQEIGQVEEAIAGLDEQLATRERDAERLCIVAPAEGMVLPPPAMPRGDVEVRLPTWSGTPLEAKNLAAFLPAGVLVCQIGELGRLKAMLAIGQSDIEFVRPGQAVDVFLEQLPTEKFRGRIEHVSRADLKILPGSLAANAGGQIETHRMAPAASVRSRRRIKPVVRSTTHPVSSLRAALAWPASTLASGRSVNGSGVP